MENNIGQEAFEQIEKRVSFNIDPKYANIVSFESSYYDFKLYFGLKSDFSNPNLDPDDFHTAIIMSPQHAKEMAKILSEQVSQYEKNVGPISELSNGRR